MKKHKQFIFIVFSLLCFAVMVSWGFICVQDYQAITKNTANSGIDYLMVDFTYAIGLMGCSFVGIILSIWSLKSTDIKWLKLLSIALTITFIAGLLVALFLWISGT